MLSSVAPRDGFASFIVEPDTQRHYSERWRDPIVVLSELSWPASRQRMPRPPEVMRLGRATSAARNV